MLEKQMNDAVAKCHIYEFKINESKKKGCSLEEIKGFNQEIERLNFELSRVRETVHNEVCRKLKLIPHDDGRSYCILHLPKMKADFNSVIADFDSVIKERFEEFDNEVARIENEFPLDNEKQKNALSALYYDFRYVWFPEKLDLSKRKFFGKAKFSFATFQGAAIFAKAKFMADANFENAVFQNVTDFYKTTFAEDADFSKAEFKRRASFRNAVFHAETAFNKAVFEAEADFKSAHFLESSEIFFKYTEFHRRVYFKYAIFAGFILFKGDENNPLFGQNSYLSLREARLKSPKRIAFHTVRLEPSWFIDTNASEFDFTACKWGYASPKTINNENVKGEFKKLSNFIEKIPTIESSEKLDALYEKNYGKGKRIRLKFELRKLRRRANAHALLTKVCWQLAHNHEESKSFTKASMFRRLAQESKRLGDNHGWKFWSWHWWYWLSSQYGESPFKAGLILFGILVLFAGAFMLTDFRVYGETCGMIPAENFCVRALRWDEAILQSLATATFQSTEFIKPHLKTSTLLIILEKILAPLQAALLALAIRRRFMS